MPLGPLPYKAKVTSVAPDASGNTLLQISVLDASSVVRNVSQYTFPSTTLLDSSAVRQLLDAMGILVVQQLLADAPDFPTAIQTVSVQVGE